MNVMDINLSIQHIFDINKTLSQKDLIILIDRVDMNFYEILKNPYQYLEKIDFNRLDIGTFSFVIEWIERTANYYFDQFNYETIDIHQLCSYKTFLHKFKAEFNKIHESRNP